MILMSTLWVAVIGRSTEATVNCVSFGDVGRVIGLIHVVVVTRAIGLISWNTTGTEGLSDIILDNSVGTGRSSLDRWVMTSALRFSALSC